MNWSRLTPWLIGAAAAVLLAGTLGLTSAQDSATPAASPVAAAAVRDVLVESEPADADGQVMQLVRYDIPAGLVLTGWNGGEPIVVVPWVAAGLFVVAVPLIAGAVAAVATPARHPIGRRVD